VEKRAKQRASKERNEAGERQTAPTIKGGADSNGEIRPRPKPREERKGPEQTGDPQGRTKKKEAGKNQRKPERSSRGKGAE